MVGDDRDEEMALMVLWGGRDHLQKPMVGGMSSEARVGE